MMLFYALYDDVLAKFFNFTIAFTIIFYTLISFMCNYAKIMKLTVHYCATAVTRRVKFIKVLYFLNG